MRPFIPEPPKEYNDAQVEGCFSWKNEAIFFYDTLQIVQPKNILETGFFKGASTFMMLSMSEANVTSVDPMVNLYSPEVKHDGCLGNVDKLKNLFPNRFNFIQKSSLDIRDDIKGQNFDLFFIDGDHWEKGIRNDFQLALDMKIPWLLVDDFVTSVYDVYIREFQRFFLSPVRIYPRKDLFQGQPIPIVLLKCIQ